MKLIQKGLRAGFLLFLALAWLTSCKDEFKERFEERKRADEQLIQEYLKANNITNFQRQPSGVYFVPGKPGTGAKVQKTSTVVFHSIGRLLNYGNAKFESTYEMGNTRRARLGFQQLVSGLEEGLQLMQEGEEATIIVPSGLGYGVYGNYSTIPGNAILLYEIAIEKVE